MKSVKLWCFLICASQSHIVYSSSKEIFEPKNASNTLSEAVESLIRNHDEIIDSINVIKDGSGFNDLEKLLMKVGFSIQTELLKNSSKMLQRRKNYFTVILINDIKSLSQFCNNIEQNKFHYNGFFLIVMKDTLSSEMETIFRLFWKKFIYNVDLLVKIQDTSKVSLYTFMPFNGKYCGDVSPVKINEFDGKTIKWTTRNVFPEKFRNLYGCPVRAGSFETSMGTKIGTFSNGTTRFDGMEVDILRGFASVLNFTLEIKIFPLNQGAFFNNKTATGLMKGAYSNEVDMIFAMLSLQPSRMEFLTATRSIYNDKIIFVIPPELLIGAIKKLLLPFQSRTWIGVLLMFFLACTVVTISKLFSQRFAVGKSDCLQLWCVLLGGSLANLPQKNFQRFLLMSFVLFCLVIRSSYSGSLYNLLRNDIRSTQIKSIDELVELEFDFYLYDSLASRLNYDKIISR